jgi:hypothetical protein
MMPEAAVALVTFVIVLLALSRWMRADTEVAVDEDEDAATARRFIEAKIDEHVEALARLYLETGGIWKQAATRPAATRCRAGSRRRSRASSPRS